MPLSNASRLADFGTGIGTAGAVIQVDNANQRLGVGTTAPTATLGVAGIVSATAFYGDGSNLEGVASAGLGTAVDDTKDSIGQNIYYTNDELTIYENTTIDAPATSDVAYTQYAQVTVESGSELIIADGDTFIPDVLGIGTGLQANAGGAGNGLFGTVYADNIENVAGRGGPNFPLGITVSGISTLSGNVSIGGTLTYEDVTNVDSIGIVTARDGIDSPTNLVLRTGGNEKVRIDSSGNVLVGTTDTTLWSNTSGAGINLRGGEVIDIARSGDLQLTLNRMTSEGANIGLYQAGAIKGTIGSKSDRIYLGSADGAERLCIASAGQLGIGGANYGTSGQVLTSGGGSAAPSWATPSGGSWELVSTVFCPDLNNAQDNIDFVGLTTAYSAYKVQFTGCTFSHRDTGARNTDKVLAYLRNTSNAWVQTTSYRHDTLRYDGGSSADGYGQTEFAMMLTHNDYVRIFSGDLIIPMAFNNENSDYGEKCFYGDFITNTNRIMFGCSCDNTDIKTTGFNGIRLQSDDNKWREGRVSLYRLKHT